MRVWTGYLMSQWDAPEVEEPHGKLKIHISSLKLKTSKVPETFEACYDEIDHAAFSSPP